MLGLILVTGSYFRNKDATRYGHDPAGKPVNTREFFDPAFFRELIVNIFLEYYNGFTEKAYREAFPLNMDNLTTRLIAEMSVDRDMEEILRVTDQNAMTDKMFWNFLANLAYSEKEIASLDKGIRDIVIQSGPHLGGFNHRISLPELIEFLAAASAFCVAGRFQTS
jgi:hypothetical protein